ncbi:MAG: antibiotic biosynthesis monooxygenase [Bacteroidota bacterium]
MKVRLTNYQLPGILLSIGMSLTLLIGQLVPEYWVPSEDSLTPSKSTVEMKTSVTEIIIYKLKAEQVKGYKELSKVADAFAGAQEGFISREVFQDKKDSTVFVDVVEWQSLESAEKAMQMSQKDERMLPFFEVTEEIISFSHYSSFSGN